MERIKDTGTTDATTLSKNQIQTAGKENKSKMRAIYQQIGNRFTQKLLTN